ncbi:hypothetical protein Anapl_08707 [Anas platyrhynchos]|uniref:Uncharacterized protein n=1 Tax=Anas platyrhynchos TaxID=8839 RepID=R0L805_ANAPL|nr:hypothetical protein Anapl_08707 [Anas platyrhynchos]
MGYALCEALYKAKTIVSLRKNSAQKPEEEGCAGLLELMRDIITNEGAGESPQGMCYAKDPPSPCICRPQLFFKSHRSRRDITMDGTTNTQAQGLCFGEDYIKLPKTHPERNSGEYLIAYKSIFCDVSMKGSSLDFRIAATTDIHAKAAGDFKESRGRATSEGPIQYSLAPTQTDVNSSYNRLIFYQVLDEKTAVENSNTIRLEQTHGLGEEEVQCLELQLQAFSCSLDSAAGHRRNIAPEEFMQGISKEQELRFCTFRDMGHKSHAVDSVEPEEISATRAIETFSSSFPVNTQRCCTEKPYTERSLSWSKEGRDRVAGSDAVPETGDKYFDSSSALGNKHKRTGTVLFEWLGFQYKGTTDSSRRRCCLQDRIGL